MSRRMVGDLARIVGWAAASLTLPLAVAWWMAGTLP